MIISLRIVFLLGVVLSVNSTEEQSTAEKSTTIKTASVNINNATDSSTVEKSTEAKGTEGKTIAVTDSTKNNTTDTHSTDDGTAENNTGSTDTGTGSKLLVVVCDGFNHAYLEQARDKGIKLNNFDHLRIRGVHAEHMKPVYPSTKFPNTWTLMTGLTPEHHGIVHDNFYDPKLEKTFKGDETPTTEFYNNGTAREGGEPIWITNQNEKHDSVVSVWPGGRVVLEGRLATYTQHTDYSITWKERVDFIIRHFTHDVAAANLGLVFLEQPDEKGHTYGPGSLEVLQKGVKQIDDILGYLLEQLQDKQIANLTNLIVMGDHGMTQARDNINLDDYVDADLYDFYGTPAAPLISPKEDKENEVYEKLSKLPHSSVYRKSDLPEVLHYSHNARISPIVLMMEEGYLAASESKSTLKERMNLEDLYGAHGYNNSLSDMWTIFLGYGPAFLPGYRQPEVDILDVYPLMCHLLGIQPQEHDGDLKGMWKFLVESDSGNGGDQSNDTPKDGTGNENRPSEKDTPKEKLGEIEVEEGVIKEMDLIDLVEDLEESDNATKEEIIDIIIDAQIDDKGGVKMKVAYGVIGACCALITIIVGLVVWRRYRRASTPTSNELYEIITGNEQQRRNKKVPSNIERRYLLKSDPDSSTESESEG